MTYQFESLLERPDAVMYPVPTVYAQEYIHLPCVSVSVTA